MLIVFAFAYDTEKGMGTMESNLKDKQGNVNGEGALQLLQRLVIAKAIQQAGGNGARPDKPAEVVGKAAEEGGKGEGP